MMLTQSGKIFKYLLCPAILVFLLGFFSDASSFNLRREPITRYYLFWGPGDVTYRYESGFPTADADAINAAFLSWQQVPDATVSFTIDAASARVDISWASLDSSILAYTTTNTFMGQIARATIQFNNQKDWSPITGFDLQNAATHEIGNLIGIDDNLVDTEATMYYLSVPGETKKRTLDQDDIDAVSFLYPTNPVNVEIVSGNGQTGTAGTPLPNDLQVRVTDTGGNPLQGEFVIFDITQGSGTLADTAPITTDANGLARTSFTPGTNNKTVVRAVAAGLKTVSFWVNNHAPVLSWTGETNYEADGLNPETGYGTTNFVFRIKYTDADNDAPSMANLWVDVDGDGLLEENEKFTMTLVGSPPYTAGVIYEGSVTIPFSAGSSNCKYYFEFSDGVHPAAGIPAGFSPATAINAPDVLQTLSVNLSATSWAIGGIEPGTIQQSPRFEVTNNGDGPETFTLWISQEASGWSAGTSSGPETYVLRGLFCGVSETPGAGVFAADDVILAAGAAAATASVFGDPSLAANGVGVAPAETRGLWLRLTAPTQTVHPGEQTIQVTVGAQP